VLQILRDGRYSVKRELSEEDRAALAIEVKLMERSLVQAGVDLKGCDQGVKADPGRPADPTHG
jgi:hypothetical protein